MASPSEFPALKNDRIIRAARGEEVDVVPVWMMRQAGRYLPEFREVRSQHDFFTVCRTPALACEVTIQPILRFPLDAAIIFSDILVVPQALDVEVRMEEKKGPVITNPIRTPEDLKRVKDAFANFNGVIGSLNYVMEAITLTRHKLEGRVPLIGFSGAPWTLMAYMIEGESSKTWAKAKSWLFNYKEESHELLGMLCDVIIDYLIGQVHAGAQLLQIFDSWAGELSPEHFKQFSLPYLLKIAEKVKERLGDKAVPMIVFPKGAHYAIDLFGGPESKYDAISIDWTLDPKLARAQAVEAAKRTIQVNGVESKRSHPITIQGNLDPCVLYAPPEFIQGEVKQMLNRFGDISKGYIANLGHGMLPDHKPEHAGVFVEAVHTFSKEQIGTKL